MPGRRRRDCLLAGVAVLALVAPSWAAELDTFDINEGELRFLTEPPARPPHLHESHVTITAESLRSGWVPSQQCHYRLDRVPALEVAFNPGRVRALRVLRADNITRVRIEGATVQLEGVGENAVLCLANEIQALKRLHDGSFEWRGGPYMRRFLDGYFPMQLKLTVEYPASQLRVESLEPVELKLRAVQQPGYLRLDALFEGRLEVLIHLISSGETAGSSR
jgi:hypothetical protein